MYELLVTNVGCGVCRPPYMAAAIIDQRGVSLGARWRVELQTKVREDFTIKSHRMPLLGLGPCLVLVESTVKTLYAKRVPKQK